MSRQTWEPGGLTRVFTTAVPQDYASKFVRCHRRTSITNTANSVPTSFGTNGCLQDGAGPACRERLLNTRCPNRSFRLILLDRCQRTLGHIRRCLNRCSSRRWNSGHTVFTAVGGKFLAVNRSVSVHAGRGTQAGRTNRCANSRPPLLEVAASGHTNC